jgi:hypothetical protein
LKRILKAVVMSFISYYSGIFLAEKLEKLGEDY